MKAFTLWQPWAALVMDGRKTIETRGQNMLYRGPLAIHAALKFDYEACRKFGYDPLTIPRGCILGIVQVEGSVRFPNLLTPPDEYGDFTPGRYGIMLRVIEKFEEPIPARGFQGLWEWVKSGKPSRPRG